MKVNWKAWGLSIFKNNKWVVKLALAFVLMAVAFRLLSSRSNEFKETPFLQESQNPKPSNLPQSRDQIPHKGTKDSIFKYGFCYF